jgi:hypothetical protein
MAKKASTGEGTGSSTETKLARDAVSLTEELIGKDGNEENDGEDPQKLADEANLRLIKSLAADVAKISVQTSKEMAEGALEEAKAKREDAKKSAAQPIAPVAPVSGVGGPVGPIGLMNNNLAAVLLALPEDKRVEYLEKNPHLLTGGLPGAGAFNPFFPSTSQSAPEKKEDGSLLGGMAQILNVQGNQASQSMLMAMEFFKMMQNMQSKAQVPSNGDGDKRFESLAMAMEKLGQMVVQGQQGILQTVQTQIQSIKSEGQAERNALYEKLFEAKEEAAAARTQAERERSDTQINALMEKLQKMDEERRQVVANPAQPLLAELRQTIELAKQQGVPISTETAEQEKARHEHELALKKLELEEKMMTRSFETKMQDSRDFNTKVGGLVKILTTLKDGHDVMNLKKTVANGGSDTARSLYQKAQT